MTYSFEQLETIKTKISEYENINDKYKLFNNLINSVIPLTLELGALCYSSMYYR